MGFYADMAEMVRQMFLPEDEGGFGRRATITRTPTVVNGVEGTVTEGTPIVLDAVVLNLPASNGTIEAFDNRLEALTLAGKRLRFLKVAAAGLEIDGVPFVPKALDVVSWVDPYTGETERWEVLGCTPLNPAGTPLLYNVGTVGV